MLVLGYTGIVFTRVVFLPKELLVYAAVASLSALNTLFWFTFSSEP